MSEFAKNIHDPTVQRKIRLIGALSYLLNRKDEHLLPEPIRSKADDLEREARTLINNLLREVTGFGLGDAVHMNYGRILNGIVDDVFVNERDCVWVRIGALTKDGSRGESSRELSVSELTGCTPIPGSQDVRGADEEDEATGERPGL